MLVLGVLTALSISQLDISSALATSSYNIRTTVTLPLGGSSPASTCGTEEEWSVRWSEFMSTDTSVSKSYKNTWNYLNDYNGARYLMDAFHNRFVSNLATGSGWAIQHLDFGGSSGISGPGVRIWLFDPSATLTVINGQIQASPGTVNYATFFYNPNASCRWQLLDYNTDTTSSIFHTEDGGLLFVASDNIVYPSDYSGPEIRTTPVFDQDHDGLNSAQEASQETLDTQEDTDKDGLGDLVESQWNANRAAVFYSSDNYPSPTIKDLYVEIDWMKDPTTNESFRPTSTQLDQVKAAYAVKGISAHFDTGEYGGGQELSQYVGELKFAPDTNNIDFFNIKNGTGDGITTPSFSSSRRGVWHYMIAGNKTSLYDTKLDTFRNTSTGASYAGDDDILIGIGRVKELASANQDQAVSGTIMHELGHNLCLSDTSYTGQDSSCVFSGIDHYAGNDYASVMNYDKQLSMVNYSTGSNGTNDHDDWSAITVGMDDFVTLGGDPSEAMARNRTIFNKQVEK